jgi:hypothetical protein
MSTLRTKLIRLAYEQPALRGDLVPLLKSAVGSGAALVGKYHLYKAVKDRNPDILEIIDEVGKSMPQYRRVVKQWKDGRLPKGGDKAIADILWALWDQGGLLKALGIDPDWKPSLKSARGNEFDYEGSDFGVMSDHRYAEEIDLFWPLENIGRRGRKVQVRIVSMRDKTSRTAWAATYMDRVKGASNARQANALLDKLLADFKAREPEGKVWDRTEDRKGVDKSLPTPTMYKIEDIKGSDIFVDMNSKPITVHSEVDGKMWADQRMTYWFKVHQRFQKKLHLLRDEIASARGLDAVAKILAREKIPSDRHTYMMPGWD